MIANHTKHYFLDGGGEMGELIRAKDWSKTPLGDPGTWPQSLRTMVAVMLSNPFGMYIAWGKEYIQLYNDGYRPILGATKHPEALGISTKNTFEEIWHIIGSMFDGVMEGKAVGFPDFMLPLNRNGFIEECYFDFSYSPIRKEDGEVGGVLVTVIETTSKKKSEEALKESEERFRSMADNIPNLAWMANADGGIYWYNKRWYEYTGTTPEQMEGWGWQSVHDPGVLPLVLDRWKHSLETGQPFEMIFPLKGADGKFRYFLTRVFPLRNSEGKIHQWFGSNTDITAQREAEEAFKQSEHRFRDTVRQAPVGITILRGRNYLVEMANDAYLQLVDRKESEFVGKPLFDSLPEVEESVHTLLDNVLTTGIPYHGIEYPIPVNRYGKLAVSYFDFLYHPLKEEDGTISGIIVTVTDVSSQVSIRAKVEESDKKLRELIRAAPFPIGVYIGKEMRIEMANEAIVGVWGKGPDVVGKLYTELLPELKTQRVFEQLDQVITSGKPFHAYNQYLDLVVDGKTQPFYFNYSFTPLFDYSGNVYGVMNTGADVTELALAKKKIEASEQDLRSMVLQAPIGICILDAATLVAEIVNDSFLEVAGKPYEAIAGKNYWEPFAEARPYYEDALNKVANEGIPFYANEVPLMLIRHGKEELIYVTFVYSPLTDKDGKVKKVAIWVMENTAQVLARQKIEDSTQKLNLVIEASELGTWELNLETDEVSYSEKYLEIFGYKNKPAPTHAQLISQLHPDDLPIRMKAFEEAFVSGVLNFQARMIRTDGATRWIEAKGKVFYNDAGKPAKLIGTVSDITRQRISQQELEESEKRFRSLAESLPQLIWETDHNGNPLFASARWQEYSGVTPAGEEEWREVIHPDDYEPNGHTWVTSLATGNVFRSDVRLKSKEGEYRWHSVIAEPVFDKENRITKWVGAFTDIHAEKEFTQELEKQVQQRTKELKLLNETLKESEQRYHLMVEEIQDYAILYLSPEGIVENWNKGAEKIKGYKPEEIIGKSFSTFYTKADKEKNLPQTLLAFARHNGKAVQEGWRVRKDGSLFWASVVITAVHNESGNVIGFSKVTHDLSEKKKADDKLKANAAELEQKNNELEKMNKELQSFAYISSHDLQEPLRKIQTFASQLVEKEFENLSANGRDKFLRMQKAAERMQTLIEDLLTYSSTSTAERKFQRTDLAKIVDEVKEDLKEELQQKNATVETGTMCDATIIPFQFRQLMYNLISNALKFSKNDPYIKIKSGLVKGSELPIEKLENDQDYCHITVSDNGIGFEPGYSQKIFEVFQRLHGRGEYAGTGIGLAIVKKIVDNHNGIITATGEVNNGATFDIYIPAD